MQLKPDFADWLDQLLEPAVEDRLASAQDAIDALKAPPRRAQSTSITPPKAKALQRKPMGSKVNLQRTRTHLNIDIPPLAYGEKLWGLAVLLCFGMGLFLCGLRVRLRLALLLSFPYFPFRFGLLVLVWRERPSLGWLDERT